MSIKPAQTHDRTTVENSVTDASSPLQKGFLNLVKDDRAVLTVVEELTAEQRNEIDSWARHSVARNGFGDF